MPRRKSPQPDLPLFDLPLRPGSEEDGEAEAAWPEDAASRGPTLLDAGHEAAVEGAEEDVEAPAEPEELLLFTPEDFEEDPPSGAEDGDRAAARAAEPAPDEPMPEAGVADRLLAGLADLAIHLGVLGLVITSVHLMGVAVGWHQWLPFSTLLLVFSFLYFAVPLAFWGRTPGMAWVGHTARSVTDEPLSFGQTVLRWFGCLMTLALVGLPLLLAFHGRSLSDRLSDSKTLSA